VAGERGGEGRQVAEDGSEKVDGSRRKRATGEALGHVGHLRQITHRFCALKGHSQ
jgi:hypothetical protein